jgi:hypothetical protein
MTTKNYLVSIVMTIWSITHVNSQIDPATNAVTRPGPSVSSLMNFEDIPVNLYTGIPDINFPLFNFPTHSKDIGVDISINYHPANLSTIDKISDIGRGWTLYDGGGVISRSLTGCPDEVYSYMAPPHNSTVNIWDDVYTYNFHGHTGKFLIIRDSQTAFHVEMLDSSTLKVEFAQGTQYLDVSSFTIYDDKGYKFVFQTYDIVCGWFPAFVQYLNSTTPSFAVYRNAYFLNKVYDNNGKELVDYSYNATVKPYNSAFNITHNKLAQITVADIGKAVFDFTYTDQPPTSSLDDFKLDAITVKTLSDQIIKKFTFTGRLAKISEFNSTLSASKEYKFFYANQLQESNGLYGPVITGSDAYGYASWKYSCTSEGIQNFDIKPEAAVWGSLQKVILPTGGSILYDFEANTVDDGFTDYSLNPRNTSAEIYNEGYFNTSVSDTYNFTVTGTTSKKLYFLYEHVPYNYPPGYEIDENPLPITYKIYSGATLLHSLTRYYNSSECQGIGDLVVLPPGSYSIKIVRPPSSAHTTGYIRIVEEYASVVQEQFDYGPGLRIRRIAYFDTDVSANYLHDPVGYPATPLREINYSYNRFDSPLKTSGVLMNGNVISYEPILKEGNTMVVYSNVKVFDTGLNGSASYTFISPYDTYNNQADWHYTHFSAIKSGLLLKKETFKSGTSAPINTQINEYDYIESVRPPLNYEVNFGDSYTNKICWPRLISSVTKKDLGGTIVQKTQTFSYNATNHLAASETSTDSNSGEILKTDYTYSTQNSTQSKNRISEVETTTNFRGAEILTTAKIVYGTGSGNTSYLPLSFQDSKGTGALENRVKINKYDDFGNLLEVQQGDSGLVTSYIWGYNKTQPVAKVENLPYASIPGGLITNIFNASGEPGLLTALKALRNDPALQNAMVTTYTYLPLLGLRSVTDPKGDVMYYEYDDFGRLALVKDKTGNILSENTYNYKPQP